MKQRSGFGWLTLIEGILLIALSIHTFMHPERTLTGFIILYGAVAVIMGIVDILLYVHISRFTGFGPIISLIFGTFSVMAGIMLLVHPDAGKLILSFLFPLWFIAHCISRLANLNTIRSFSNSFTYYVTLIFNIIGLILGALMIANPWVSFLSMRFIVGIYLLLLGIDCIIIAVSNIGSRL